MIKKAGKKRQLLNYLTYKKKIVVRLILSIVSFALLFLLTNAGLNKSVNKTINKSITGLPAQDSASNGLK